MLSPNAVYKTVEQTLSYSNLSSIPASRLIPDAPYHQSLVDWAVESIEETYRYNDRPIDIAPDGARMLLEDSTIPEFVKTLAACYTYDLLHGTSGSYVTADDVYQVLAENADLIYEISGVYLDNQAIGFIVNEIEETNLLELTSITFLQYYFPGVYQTLRILTSYWTIGLSALVTLVMILLLMLVNRRKFSQAAGGLGITWTTLGVITMLPAAFAALLPRVWSSLFGHAYAASLLSGAFLARNLVCWAVVLVLGVALILVKIFTGKSRDSL